MDKGKPLGDSAIGQTIGAEPEIERAFEAWLTTVPLPHKSKWERRRDLEKAWMAFKAGYLGARRCLFRN